LHGMLLYCVWRQVRLAKNKVKGASVQNRFALLQSLTRAERVGWGAAPVLRTSPGFKGKMKSVRERDK
jgi:hypothetical protein